MKALFVSLALGLGLIAAQHAHAQAPAGAPAGSTGLCKDGSYTSNATKRGACRGHKGVKEWYESASAPAAATKAASKTAAAPAAASTAAPAGSTGLCKDGSYTSNATKRGACRGHKGVKEWYEGAAAPAAAPAAPAAASRVAPAPAPAAAPAAATPPRPAATAAPGGGTGQVWVNSESKVFHCQGDEWYGKTKQGSYMTEAAALAAGNHAAHGKSCSAQ
jgi:hypothetical protein